MADWRNNYISPSRVDNFAQYLSGNLHNYQDADGWLPPYTDELFIDSLLVREETEAMRMGTALHEVLETARFKTLENYFVIDGYIIEMKFDAVLEIPELREMWIGKRFNNLFIRGKIDAVSSSTIHDFKFTKQINLEKYINSWQWKIYLWMTGKNKFIYDLFRIKSSSTNLERSATMIQILEYQKLPLERYKNLNQDVEDFYLQYWDVLGNLKDRIFARAKELKIIIKEK